MSTRSAVLAKLSGLYKNLQYYFTDDIYVIPTEVGEDFFERYQLIRLELIDNFPVLYSDLPERVLPDPFVWDDGDISYNRDKLRPLLMDMEYIFEVRAHSEIVPVTDLSDTERIFISHGRSKDWIEVQAFIEKDIGFETLELAQMPNRGRTVLQKLDEESNQCSFAVVVMTGDDSLSDDTPRVRENVMHEIGYFQGKYGLANVCLLYEDGTSIPSNITGVVYIPFTKGFIHMSFSPLLRELKMKFNKS